ncbi:Hypothetical predicted protein, partial [Marmota monax]
APRSSATVAAPKNWCPAPRAQAAAAAALQLPPLKHRSPRRGMQNDPRAGSARGCSGEQATQALKAAVQPLEDRAR